MAFGRILSATDASASGLAAERLRMEVVANNIANAHSTRTAEGGAFRRREVVFSAAYDDALGSANAGGMGVEVIGIQPSKGELPKVYDPSHPDADATGHVEMPNVNIPDEMVDLITASRGYEANLRALKSFKQMVEQALSLLRGANS